MTDKAKCRPQCCNTEGGGGTDRTLQGTDQLHQHHTTVQRDRQGRISPLLRSGSLTLRELEVLTGLDGRLIRRMIEAERREGVPIVSDNRCGYWLAGVPADARRFAKSMRHRAAEIIRTAEAIEEAAGID